MKESTFSGKTHCTEVSINRKIVILQRNRFFNFFLSDRVSLVVQKLNLDIRNSEIFVVGVNSWSFFFFSIRVFFHGHWRLTGQQGRGGDHLLFHFSTFHPVTNIQTFICNFVREIAITYFWSQRLYLPDCYSMRFTTLSNYYLTDWWRDVDFRLFGCWFDFRLYYNYLTWEEPVDVNSHRVSSLYYKRTD